MWKNWTFTDDAKDDCIMLSLGWRNRRLSSLFCTIIQLNASRGKAAACYGEAYGTGLPGGDGGRLMEEMVT